MAQKLQTAQVNMEKTLLNITRIDKKVMDITWRVKLQKRRWAYYLERRRGNRWTINLVEWKPKAAIRPKEVQYRAGGMGLCNHIVWNWCVWHWIDMSQVYFERSRTEVDVFWLKIMAMMMTTTMDRLCIFSSTLNAIFTKLQWCGNVQNVLYFEILRFCCVSQVTSGGLRPKN